MPDGWPRTRYEELNLLQGASEHDPFTVERYEQFLRFFPTGATKILDVGCNTGRGGQVLRSRNVALVLTGLECVKSRIDRLPAGLYADVVNSTTTPIDCADNSFDVVVAGEFIEHLNSNEVLETLSEFFRVLNLGGRLLLTTPNPSDIKRRIRRESVLGGAHLSQHHARTLALELKMVGFSRVRIYGSGRMTRYLGSRFPARVLYGSYLASADKW